MTDLNGAAAQSNFSELSRNSYPGRGIVAGLDETSQYLAQVYWIMGRSENSRNRVFKYDRDTGRVYTEAADAAKMKDPALVIYNAMRETRLHYVVSNGDQTDTVIKSKRPSYLDEALAERLYEPDAPNFTPRITAVSQRTVDPAIHMSILRKSVFGDGCDAATYTYIPYLGFGHCITTYAGDGDPLPPFRGDPLLMPLRGGLGEVAETYWSALNEANRVSLAVKFIELKTGRSNVHLINEYAQKG